MEEACPLAPGPAAGLTGSERSLLSAMQRQSVSCWTVADRGAGHHHTGLRLTPASLSWGARGCSKRNTTGPARSNVVLLLAVQVPSATSCTHVLPSTEAHMVLGGGGGGYPLKKHCRGGRLGRRSPR